MRYELRLTAYDMLDQVHVEVAIYRSVPDGPFLSELVGNSGSTVRGTGESDQWQWARDALVQALETL